MFMSMILVMVPDRVKDIPYFPARKTHFFFPKNVT